MKTRGSGAGPFKSHGDVEGGWVLTGGGAEGEELRFVFGETELAEAYLGLTIGRAATLNDRVVTDAAVSRRHCRIGLADGGLFVEDLNSLNGTLVDDMELTPFQPLAVTTGQRITIGRITLLLTPLAT